MALPKPFLSGELDIESPEMMLGTIASSETVGTLPRRSTKSTNSAVAEASQMPAN